MPFFPRWLSEPASFRRRDVVLYLVISAFFYVLYSVKIASSPLIAADSSGYIYFHQTRPVLYSAFVYVVKAITGSYKTVPPVQLLFYVAAAFVLALRVRDYLANGLIGLFVLVFVLLDAPIILTAGSILSDVMSAGLIALFTSESLRYVGSKGEKAALTKSLLAACAIAVRPINVVVSLADAAMVVLSPLKSRRTKVLNLVGVIGCAALGLGITPLVHDLMYGSPEGGSPLARGLFQKAIYVPPIDEQAYIDCIGPDAFRIVQAGRTYVEQAPPAFRRQLMYSMSDYLRFSVLLPLIADKAGLDAEWKADPKLSCYAAQAMKEHPFTILGNNMREFWALLSSEPFLSAGKTQDLMAYLAAVPPPLPAPVQHPTEDARLAARLQSDFSLAPSSVDQSFFHPGNKIPTAAIDGIRLFVFAINVCGIFAFVAWFFTEDPLIRDKLLLSACLSLLANAGMFITSNIEFAISRYQFVYWPATLTSAALLIWSAIAFIRRARSGLGDTASWPAGSSIPTP